ncbi:hypothetical protein [Xenophilus sp. Marseille-Q4582]|uniref:hypothetical protein n=1 Tax=Xenophilus sp. Marseille-Q4582 TaxID=2866600 RepID=UPI001CE3B9FC|nr:hypothetical protein [Xenophilus sp. Marseille-Q4582]
MPSSTSAPSSATAPPAPLPSRAPGASLRADWPFQTVYLWDAPARLAPLLLLGALAGTWLPAGGPQGQALHRALDMALPWLALFHLLWPLYGPRRAEVRARLQAAGWRASLARWAPRALGPGRIALAARAMVLLLLLAAALAARPAPVLHQALAWGALALLALQGLGALWQHRRAGESLRAALLRGEGTGRPQEALQGDSSGWAWALAGLVPACWLWQALLRPALLS